MTEALGLILRALYTAGTLLLFGTLVCLGLAQPDRTLLDAWQSKWLRLALLLAIASLALGLGVLWAQLASLRIYGPGGDVLRRLLLDSRFGMIWIMREALLLAAGVSLAVAPRVSAGLWAALLLAGASLAIAPLSGHSAAIEPAWPPLVAHALHMLAAGAWWGALPALAALLATAARQPAVSVFQRFSTLALPLMAVIIATGLLLARTHVERWPPLFGTLYGYLLLGKVAALVAVLWMASHLRRALLPMLQTGADAALARRTALWIAAEFLLALLIVALASQLAQTVPGRHDAVVWHLPFRVSVDATWDTRWVPEKVYGGIALLLVAAGLALAVWHGRLTRAAWLSAIALLGAAGLALAVHALLVDAYPETYRRSSVPYQTVSVAVGAELFEQHCAGCHGRTGRGDGELGKALSIRPADLTEPHTALHTAGDLFWWLTHGKPPGVMPGFANRLSEDDRWDLINFLRTLSVGYQARIITERVLPGHPWLPAIDFNFTTTAGRSGTLKDYRERSAVLLVFFTWPDSAERLAALARDAARLQAAGTEVLAVPLRPQGGIDLPALPIVDEGAEDTARSYALLRRTLFDPDSRDEHPVPQHMELLVDRFGYIRARWLPRQGVGWNDIARLLEQIALLQREPQIKPPPDEHVH